MTKVFLGSDEKIWKRKREKEKNERWIDNGIRFEGAKSISESLKVNTSLTSLNLGGDEKIRNEKEKRKGNEMKEMNR